MITAFLQNIAKFIACAVAGISRSSVYRYWLRPNSGAPVQLGIASKAARFRYSVAEVLE